MNAGVVPVKHLARAKQRLAPHLSASERTEVARALFEDALALTEQVDFLSWWVVSDDEEVLRTAARRGLGVIEDPGRGLNEALRRAATVAKDSGALSVTVVPADVPLAWRGDIQDLVDTGATSDVVLVPSGRDGGTNALYWSPPDLLQPQFGERSLKAHLSLAERLELRCSLLTLPRLALDIDTIQDVDAFLTQARHPSRSVELLRRLREAPAAS